MTILVPEMMMFGRSLFPDVNITAAAQILIADTTYLAHPGLTLLPSGQIQVTNDQGEGEWIIGVDLSVNSVSGSSRTSVRAYLTFNGIEIPSTRRFIYCRLNGMGSAARLSARLTNLSIGDTLAVRGETTAGAGPVRVHSYGMFGEMSKVLR